VAYVKILYCTELRQPLGKGVGGILPKQCMAQKSAISLATWTMAEDAASRSSFSATTVHIQHFTTSLILHRAFPIAVPKKKNCSSLITSLGLHSLSYMICTTLELDTILPEVRKGDGESNV